MKPLIPNRAEAMAKREVALSKGYAKFLADLKDRIRAAQHQALQAVNKELVGLYWDIGKMIVARQKRHPWGNAVVGKIACDLQKEFHGLQGFSSSGLWRMRNFYLEYHQNTKLARMVREIGWSHNLVILEKCKNPLEREFYIRMTRRMGWARNILTHQIENKTYEKTLSGQTNFDQALPEKIKNRAQLAVKDEYVFDFLGLKEEHNELELEKALTSNISRFLREMGGVFAFVGDQYRLEVDGQEFFIDILLYHRRLKCLVAVELKIGEFKPEYAGKMQFYLSALDDTVKENNENPSIGIILCKSKRRMIVEYTLRQSKKPIGVGQYKLVTEVPRSLRKELPSPGQIRMLLKEV
ncbi:MAG: PDDEXK nuclease domain-containing protein [Candidatus Omnitrophota bacterium]